MLADLGWQAALKRDPGLRCRTQRACRRDHPRGGGAGARPEGASVRRVGASRPPDTCTGAVDRYRLGRWRRWASAGTLGTPIHTEVSNVPEQARPARGAAGGLRRHRPAPACHLRRATPPTPIRASRPITWAACRSGAASSTRPPAPSCSIRRRAPAPSTSRSTPSSIDFGQQKLNEHAKGPDLFDVAKYPTATYKGQAGGLRQRRAHQGGRRVHTARRDPAADADLARSCARNRDACTKKAAARMPKATSTAMIRHGLRQGVRLQDGGAAGDPGGGRAARAEGAPLRGLSTFRGILRAAWLQRRPPGGAYCVDCPPRP